MDETRSTLTYLGVVAAAAISGMWAYVRPVPRQLCEERHLHLAEDVGQIKRDLTSMRLDVAECLALLSTRRERASAAAKKAFALSLRNHLDQPPPL